MQYAIEIKNLCKQYPKFALQSVSFTLPMGYIMGFIGENGAGKTTVMKSMLHLVRPDSGTVLLLGQDATKENAALKQQIGVVLDTANFPQSFIRFIGVNNTIEIWAKEKAEQPFMDPEEFSEALQDILGEENLGEEEAETSDKSVE